MKTKSAKNVSTIMAAPFLLRAGLAFVFLYAGIGALQHPATWVGYLPNLLTKAIAATTALKIIAVYEIILALWLLSGKYIRYAAWLSALTLAGIVVANSNQLIITFRDIGLVCMALALANLEQ